jgi:hypothetical protein
MNDNIPAGYDENGVRGGDGRWEVEGVEGKVAVLQYRHIDNTKGVQSVSDDCEITDKYLRNEFLAIRIDSDLSMCGKDLTDMNNEPTTITISKRGLKKAVEAVREAFNNEMKLNDFEDILEKCNIRMHNYCAVD